MYRRRVTPSQIIVHTVLTVLTGGAWLVVLFIRYLLANS